MSCSSPNAPAWARQSLFGNLDPGLCLAKAHPRKQPRQKATSILTRSQTQTRPPARRHSRFRNAYRRDSECCGDPFIYNVTLGHGSLHPSLLCLGQLGNNFWRYPLDHLMEKRFIQPACACALTPTTSLGISDSGSLVLVEDPRDLQRASAVFMKLCRTYCFVEDILLFKLVLANNSHNRRKETCDFDTGDHQLQASRCHTSGNTQPQLA